jgi:hypothetical protein
MAALTIVLSMLLMTVVLVVGILLKVSTSPPLHLPPHHLFISSPPQWANGSGERSVCGRWGNWRE